MKVSYKISSTENEAIRKKMKETKRVSIYRRLEAAALLSEGKKAKEVAEITGYHEKKVRQLGLEYHKVGLDAYAHDERKGGNHRTMSRKEAQEFLKPFEEKAKNGHIITVGEIAEEFDRVTGKKRKSLSTIYSFLHANGWRKTIPRGQHPKKASEEEIESSKKLTIG